MVYIIHMYVRNYSLFEISGHIVKPVKEQLQPSWLMIYFQSEQKKQQCLNTAQMLMQRLRKTTGIEKALASDHVHG